MIPSGDRPWARLMEIFAPSESVLSIYHHSGTSPNGSTGTYSASYPWVAVMMDYEKYKADCAIIRETNENLLNEFRAWLRLSGLSDKTIRRHYSNIDFYINRYLLYEDAIEAKDGVNRVDDFLGGWYARKVITANATGMKSNVTSLKKFYSFLLEKGLVRREDYVEFEETIKEELPSWQETLEDYEDPFLD